MRHVSVNNESYYADILAVDTVETPMGWLR